MTSPPFGSKSHQTGSPELVAGTRVGEYEITGKIGQGGMGLVYAGHHPVIGKRVAVKVLQPAFSNDSAMAGRFLREARAVNAIGHGNIVDIFAFGELPGGQLYFVMEFLHGESLGDRLRRVREGRAAPLQVSEMVPLLLEICDALSAAHATGIVHRDLKPDNIFVTLSRSHKRTVKLLDFGIAKLTMHSSVRQTGTGMPMGTPLYMSPEQCRGHDVDPRSDIYSLGVVIYEAFVGQPPFDGASFIDVINAHLSQPPPQPGEFRALPAVLQRLILACLSKDPSSRPSLAEIADRLREVGAEASAQSRPGGEPGSIGIRLAWYGATIALSALLATLVSLLFR